MKCLLSPKGAYFWWCADKVSLREGALEHAREQGLTVTHELR